MVEYLKLLSTICLNKHLYT